MLNGLASAILAFYLSLGFVSGAGAAELVSDFDQSSLDEKVWNACQIDEPPLRFEQLTDPEGTVRQFIRVIVDPTTGNSNDTCQEPVTPLSAGQEADVVAEPFGPSLVPASPPEEPGAAECKKGGGEAQRNELRLQQRPGLVHSQEEAHWYSMTFRVDGNVPSCGSARWVLAQWKQERHGMSPFLAQRFDNGVLHVTVQNGHCRCAVAKAEGDFDTFSAVAAQMLPAQTLRESRPIRCIRSDVDDDTSCQPTAMHVFTIGGSAPPPLPDPKRGWVTMTYLVRGGSDGNGLVDVYANSRFVVRVNGLIGYKTNDPGLVKFKFGHYRDRIDGAASISVDRLCFSPDSHVCAPDIQSMP